MPTAPPKFRIEYRDSEGKTEVIDEVSDLDDSYNAIYDLLDNELEIWIHDITGQGISDSIANYLIDDMARNISDDGQPLIIRRMKNSMMFRTDLRATPFGLRAYKFYRQYLGKSEVQGMFKDSSIKRYERIIGQQRTTKRRQKRRRKHQPKGG